MTNKLHSARHSTHSTVFNTATSSPPCYIYRWKWHETTIDQRWIKRGIVKDKIRRNAIWENWHPTKSPIWRRGLIRTTRRAVRMTILSRSNQQAHFLFAWTAVWNIWHWKTSSVPNHSFSCYFHRCWSSLTVLQYLRRYSQIPSPHLWLYDFLIKNLTYKQNMST